MTLNALCVLIPFYLIYLSLLSLFILISNYCFSYYLIGSILIYLSATLRISISINLVSSLIFALLVSILPNFKFTTVIRHCTAYPINSTLSVQTIIKLLYSFSDTYKLFPKKICTVLVFVPIFVSTRKQ